MAAPWNRRTRSLVNFVQETNKRGSPCACSIGKVPPRECHRSSLSPFLPLVHFFFTVAFYSPARASANCEKVLAGKSFWIRLLDPEASYSSKPGSPVRAVLIQSPECDANPVFPAGLEVDGEVTSVRKVGLGIVHESAFLELRFTRIVTASGETLPIAADIVEIDNARETLRQGVIRGIRATNSPQGRLTTGLLHLPTFNP